MLNRRLPEKFWSIFSVGLLPMGRVDPPKKFTKLVRLKKQYTKKRVFVKLIRLFFEICESLRVNFGIKFSHGSIQSLDKIILTEQIRRLLTHRCDKVIGRYFATCAHLSSYCGQIQKARKACNRATDSVSLSSVSENVTIEYF